MFPIKPKKRLGQHFLVDRNIASKIVKQLTLHCSYETVLEIGPGLGILTEYLLNNHEYKTCVIEIDPEMTAYLRKRFEFHPGYSGSKFKIIEGDFLKFDLNLIFDDKFGIIGNFPYNISSQILFKILENKDKVFEVVCMLQKEVAQRIASKPGNKKYGILSVLLQAFYDIELLFTVNETVFEPKPKVKSAVLRLIRRIDDTSKSKFGNPLKIQCDEKLFFKIVKQSFQNRRKTLRNALKKLTLQAKTSDFDILNKRAEQLTVDEFIELTRNLK